MALKNSVKDVDKIIEGIKIGTVSLLPEADLKKKLESGKKLKIKFGADPTAPDLHLGHAVVLSKLRLFQDMGHDVIFLIGDFTARIGDPTGRSKTRSPLTKEQIEFNTKTYLDQVKRIMDPSKPLNVRFNSEWLEKISCDSMVKLCSRVTLARLTEREDFSKRIDAHQPISFHELLYPIFQAYDSVALEADIELGGTDQTFNLLFGRYLQEQFGQEPQVILTMPLLVGLDGVQKMSKSLGNYIGLTDEPGQAFGKLMSISDVLMWRYFELLLNTPAEEISIMQERIAGDTLNPMSLKKDMAHKIITKFWSKEAADIGRDNFETLFQKKDFSAAQEIELPAGFGENVWIVDFLKQLDGIKSSSDARRLIEAGAVTIDGEVIKDSKATINAKSGMTVKIGKHRFYKIK
ncbi:MAG: Tyrosine-tRNA ligase [candidate division TM6 bacterium GW2011_GWF2_30_66]|nr:MAG: Tyrosine-tRNA ligase [candidate division TM6 bacterium GW2011_GWF2_30_66]